MAVEFFEERKIEYAKPREKSWLQKYAVIILLVSFIGIAVSLYSIVISTSTEIDTTQNFQPAL